LKGACTVRRGESGNGLRHRARLLPNRRKTPWWPPAASRSGGPASKASEPDGGRLVKLAAEWAGSEWNGWTSFDDFHSSGIRASPRPRPLFSGRRVPPGPAGRTRRSGRVGCGRRRSGRRGGWAREPGLEIRQVGGPQEILGSAVGKSWTIAPDYLSDLIGSCRTRSAESGQCPERSI